MRKLLFIIFLLINSNPLFIISQEKDNLLNSYLQNYQYQKAIDYINNQEPTKGLLTQKALCFKAIRQYKEAIAILKKLAEEYPSDTHIKSELALCYEALGERNSSLDYYNQLINIDSTNVYFKLQKADLLYQKGDYRDALTLFQNIKNEDNINTLKRSAQCFEKINFPDSAIVYYKEAWDADQNDWYAAANLINLCLKNKRITEAVSYSDLYLEKDTTNEQINLLNALSYYSMDMYEESIKKFKKCYAEGDTSVIVNRSIGIAYYSLNDSYEAQPYLETAFRQDTTNNHVLYCLAVACNDMGEHAKSIPLFRKLLDRTILPDFTLYLYYKNTALAYEKGSQFENAADYYLKALAYAGSNQKMTMYYTLAKLYDQDMKKYGEAFKYYNLYNDSLKDYLKNLRAKEDTDPTEIKETESKIKYLEEHIGSIKKQIPK